MEIPNEIKKWNWGALFLAPFWCLRHGVWQGLLLLVPPLTFIMPFIFGALGNKWAWRKELNPSIIPFLRRQRIWGLTGALIWGLFFAIFIYALNFSSGVVRSLEIANSNSRLTAILGKPIAKSSFFRGTNQYSRGDKTEQYISFLAYGPKESGTIDFHYEKKGGNWVLQGLEVTDGGGEKQKLIDSPVLNTSYSRSICDLNDILQIFEKIEKDRDGFVILTRSLHLNDFIQAGIDVQEDGTFTYEVIYSHGYHPKNKELYKLKKFVTKEDVISLFNQYSSGSDAHFHLPYLVRLKEMVITDAKHNLGYFLFEGEEKNGSER